MIETQSSDELRALRRAGGLILAVTGLLVLCVFYLPVLYVPLTKLPKVLFVLSMLFAVGGPPALLAPVLIGVWHLRARPGARLCAKPGLSSAILRWAAYLWLIQVWYFMPRLALFYAFLLQ